VLIVHPAWNLLAATFALVVAYLGLRPRAGWVWRWQRRAQPERVRIEDALKHLYSCQESGRLGSIDSIAGALEIGRNESASLSHRLEQRGLVTTVFAGLQLTDKGSQYALQVIRTHRLWEQYLAERTGVGEGEWHEQADRMEHEMTPEEADALAARIGDPAFDPHGDPIPSSTGQVQRPKGELLTSVAPGALVRIVHIEDEPESSYRELRAAKLQSGMLITVVGATGEGVVIDTGANHCLLSPLVAANVAIQAVDEEEAERVSLRRLSSLAPGEEAEVTDISPACRGLERRRLLDLGLVPGTVVRAEFASPAGDPVAYRVRGALIALRSHQAAMIHIGSACVPEARADA
jgi:DtxR family Mn-dependent transcriptional regulator